MLTALAPIPKRFAWLPTAFVLLAGVLCAGPVRAGVEKPCRIEDPPSKFPTVRLEQIARGFNDPVGLYPAGDGSGRLFVVEQDGEIRVLRDGKKLSRPFLDIRKRVRSGGETGLLGLALHPGFQKNGRFFVNYTRSRDGLQTVVAEFRVKDPGGSADAESEKILLTFDQPYANHNGGQMAFGPDGYLYIGTGDGGSGNDPHGNGQRLNTLLGKILRIDVDQKSKSKPYAVPKDNPFADRKDARPEIWAYGLRNPWRFSFDPLDGTLYAADVGQRAREEINVIRKGKNYGWNIMEGNLCTPGVDPDCDPKGLEKPIIDYPRSEGVAVIGGYVYRGRALPGLCGAYLYGDYGSGTIWALRYDGKTVTRQEKLLESRRPLTSFGQDEAGEVYVVEHGGRIFKILPEITPPEK